MINDKAILVGVDGSHASYKATWWAANYAKHAGLTLQIVCAYSLPSYAAVSFDATYTAMGDDNAAHSDAQEILSKAKAIAAAREAGLPTLRGADASEDIPTLLKAADAGSEPFELVRERGVEPPRPFGHTDLNRARLPFRHSRVSPHGDPEEISTAQRVPMRRRVGRLTP